MAVLGLMHAVASLGTNRHVIGILAAAENMPGPDAYRPGDVLKMFNGVTVEITNTDAEGRLVLADALAWGIKTYKPAACVDLATLTGGCVVALGEQRAGAFGRHDDFWETVRAASDHAGEPLWRLPIGEDFAEQLRSAQSADVVNSPGRWGSACTAAEFLSLFVPEDTKWLHLDIAGPAETSKDLPLYAKGATGFAVRTLVKLAEG
jgi:leucyl aminopeptidase